VDPGVSQWAGAQRLFPTHRQRINVSKYVFHSTSVVKDTFDESSDEWTFVAGNGNTFTWRFFVCCLGFSAKCHTPN
jgi:hypothetical protein